MTNPTPHGQVPEALIDLIDAYAETRHRYGRIHNAKTEAARNAVIEALSGVQALSAAPAIKPLVWSDESGPTDKIRYNHITAETALGQFSVEWKGRKEEDVPCVYLTGDYIGVASDLGGAKMLAEQHIRELVANLLAASPTPPVEQQAAPKAAPGELHDHQILAITTAYEQGVGKGHQAHESGKEIANPYDTAYRCDLAWQYGYKEGKEQAERIAGTTPQQPAPQQGAQEPIGWTTGITWRPNTRLHSEQVIKITRDAQPKYGYTTPIYTAPQPAPAPLSDEVVKDAARYRWLREGNDAKHGAAWHVAVNLYGCEWDAAIDAAIAAQGGKV